MKLILNPKTWPLYARALFIYGFVLLLVFLALLPSDSKNLFWSLGITASLMMVAVFHAQRKILFYLIATAVSVLFTFFGAIWAWLSFADIGGTGLSVEDITVGAYFALGALLLIYGIIGGGIELYKQWSHRGQ